MRKDHFQGTIEYHEVSKLMTINPLQNHKVEKDINMPANCKWYVVITMKIKTITTCKILCSNTKQISKTESCNIELCI